MNLSLPAPPLALPPAAPPGTGFAARATCKCCGSPALLEGYADFDRDCYGVNAGRGQVRGQPVPYYRCSGCDFAFTEAFDHWGEADFRTHVYNDEYPLFDPKFAQERPRNTAALVQRLAPQRETRILDFGGGEGATAALLREAGYAHVDVFDPFHAAGRPEPTGPYDLVLCIEVAEHHTRPLALFAQLHALAGEAGTVLLSTRDFSEVRGRWVDDWYVAPRNGHVSFYTQRTLGLLGASLGRAYLRVDGFRHLLLPVGSA